MKFKLLKLIMKESSLKEDVEEKELFNIFKDLPDEVKIDGIQYKMTNYGGEGNNNYAVYEDVNNPDSYLTVHYSLNKTGDDSYKGVKEIHAVDDLRESVLRRVAAEETLEESAEDRYQVREFDGPGAKFGVYDTKTKKFVQKGSKNVMNAACNDLNKKNLKEEFNTYKDKDEAEYYRNKELYKNSNLARHRDAMNKAKKACDKKGIKLKEEETSFEEIINEMSNAESYEELYNAAMKIADPALQNDVTKFIQQCEDDGDSVEEAYSIVTTDLLDDKTQDLNEDAYITINDGSKDADYIVQDVTELEDVDDDTVEAPSVEGLLSLVNESLNNKYGSTWGFIKSKSISMKENLQYAIIDIVTPQILREAKENKVKDNAVSKTIILESVPNSKSMVNLKVNTLAGTTRFSQKTKEPAKVLTRWLESEYLYDEMVKDFQDKLAARQATLKDSTESYLKHHPDLKVRIDVIKAQEKMLKDAGMLEDSMDDLARTAYAIAVEFPANIKVDGNKDNEYNMEFDTVDEIVKILFGESYVRDIPKEEKELAKKNKKVLKDNLKEGALPNISKFIYDLDKDSGNAWSAQHYTKDGNGNKIIIVSKNGTSDKTAEDIKSEVENRYQNLKGEITENGNNVWFYLQESSLKESYAVKCGDKYVNMEYNSNDGKYIYSLVDEKDATTYSFSDGAYALAKDVSKKAQFKDARVVQIYKESSLKEGYENFKIGEIEGTFNTSTGEAMYSIPSKNVTDKKISLDKIPSTDTPYDTDTIIKNYIETHYGVIDRETEVEVEPDGNTEIDTEVTEKEPIEKSTDVQTAEEAEELEDTGVDISDELEEDAQSETGTASFYKIRQREPLSIEDVNEKIANGGNSQESEYIVVKEINLTPDEMQSLTSDLSKPQEFLQGIEPIDRKNYPFNVVKVTSEVGPTLLIDPVGYNYSRYIAII